VIDSTYS